MGIADAIYIPKTMAQFFGNPLSISHEIRYVVIPIPRVMAGLLSIDVFKISTYIG
jgi:hypothetical protein